jgi:recombination protein RecT
MSENGKLLTPQDKVVAFKATLDRMHTQIAQSLPSHVRMDWFCRNVLLSVQQNPELLDCQRSSLLSALLAAAQVGLEPNSVLGNGYLIPRYSKKHGGKIVTFQLGYKGLLRLAERSGLVSSVEAHVVYSKDTFEYEFGLEQRLVHRPARRPLILGDDGVEQPDPNWAPGAITHVYAVAHLKDGQTRFDVMDFYEIDAIRERAEAKTGPWHTDWPEMAKKTVLRRLHKLLPQSIEMQGAIATDERSEAGIIDEVVLDEPPTATGKSSLDDLADKSKAKRKGEETST